jgi:hypothetical protein
MPRVALIALAAAIVVFALPASAQQNIDRWLSQTRRSAREAQAIPESERWNGSNKIRTIRTFVAEGARNIGAHYLQAGTDGRSRAQ